MTALKETKLEFDGLKKYYKGKVRDVYYFDDLLAIVVSDRISAFDVVLPEAIPYKGQVLNEIAAISLAGTEEIVPNWVLSQPAPNVTIGKNCAPFAVEMVIRAYLVGHAWREYKVGKRVLCGVTLPEGMKENDKFPEPIITPTTKAHQGHDEDISREDILKQGIVAEEDYIKLETYTKEVFRKGAEIAAKQGLILADTKYEFGKYKGEITLIDEIHTPDSSRYFYADTYEDLQKRGERQRQLSKEFVREWLMENNFQGKKGQKIPDMTEEVTQDISVRYIELYEKVTGQKFVKKQINDNLQSIIKKSLDQLL
jgi:phosphoribosylaminoimidazole-succinocarboxamide synthase